ncbi:MAG: arsenate reductase ArsC [Clostridia bacterium]
MIKVLFVCSHNSARSQMAEAFLNKLGEGCFEAESAGLEIAQLNPLVIKVMEEIGYDLSRNSIDSVFDFYKAGKTYSVVVKVCDQANGQQCPVFPRTFKVLDWNFDDPTAFQGTDEKKLAKTRKVRDEIKAKVEEFITENKEYALNRMR